MKPLLASALGLLVVFAAPARAAEPPAERFEDVAARTRVLASGKGLKLDRVNGNTYRVELRGQRIQIWVDGEPVVDVTDDKMGVAVGGKTLDHGGFAVGWGWEAMGWIRRLSVTGL